jgi:hypothetical protein
MLLVTSTSFGSCATSLSVWLLCNQALRLARVQPVSPFRSCATNLSVSRQMFSANQLRSVPEYDDRLVVIYSYAHFIDFIDIVGSLQFQQQSETGPFPETHKFIFPKT